MPPNALSTDPFAVWYRQMLEHLGQGVALLDTQGRLVWCNRAYVDITGYASQSSIGKSPPHIPDHDRLLRRADARLNASGQWQGEITGRTAAGAPLPLLVGLSQIPNPDGGHPWLVESFFEIDAHLNYIKQLEWRTLHDSLSGLPNREYFKTELTSVFRREHNAGQTIAVMFVDLNGFKAVNDTAGHEAGDYALAIIAQRLQRIAKTRRAFAARMGGDEFALFLLADKSKAEHLALEVLRSIEKPIKTGTQHFILSASIGICLDQCSGSKTSELLRRADESMYRIKKQGRGGYGFTPPLSHSTNNNTMNEVLQHDIDHAIRKGHFCAFFQPIVNVQTGTITALETRARWRSATGMLSAREVMERVTSMEREQDLDFVMLEQAHAALGQLERNLSTAPNIRIAVNLTATSCWQDTFFERLFEHTSHLPADRFRLEIPEQAFTAQPRMMAERVAFLTGKGYEVAADHITSAEMITELLAEMPLTVIKPDEKLVRKLPEDDTAARTLSALLTTAARYGIGVGFEDISRLNQLDWLRKAGGQECQGDLISKPRALTELTFLLKKGRCW